MSKETQGCAQKQNWKYEDRKLAGQLSDQQSASTPQNIVLITEA